MQPTVTLFDLVTAIGEFADNDREIVATIVHMVNGGRVRLAGALAGARIELPPRRATAAA